MFSRHRNTGRMNDIGLDAAAPQPSREPEPVATSFKGYDQTADFAAGLRCLIAPAVQLSNQARFIRLQLLQRCTSYAWNHPGDESGLQTHFDHSYQRAILIEGGEGSAEVINVRHGALHRLLGSVDGASSSPPAP